MGKHRFGIVHTKPHLLYIIPLLFVGLVSSLVANGILLYINYDRSVVEYVPDGDSITLKDGRRVRLLGIDAPEKGSCFADEAKEMLVMLVKGKGVVLKDEVADDYGRLLANIYVGKIFVNGELVRGGYARNKSVSSPEYETLQLYAKEARNNEQGIYSPVCRQKNPMTECVIKGNIRHGQKTYHLPDCPNYNDVIMDLSFGDTWFCGEEEAQQAGFEKASGCR